MTAAAERKRIRAEIVSHLKAKSSVDKCSIFNSRVRHVAADKCPAINVFTPRASGKNEDQAGHVPGFDYDLTVRVDITVALTADNWADTLDDLCDEVDALIMTDAGLLRALDVTAFTAHNTTIQVSGESESIIATAQIEYGITFGWDYEPTIVDSLGSVHVDVDAIDPADPNTGHEDDEGGYRGGQPGPEGRVEAQVVMQLGGAEPDAEPEPEPEPEQEPEE